MGANTPQCITRLQDPQALAQLLQSKFPAPTIHMSVVQLVRNCCMHSASTALYLLPRSLIHQASANALRSPLGPHRWLQSHAQPLRGLLCLL